MAHAFFSQRVVTPEGTGPAALIVQDGIIATICPIADIPTDAILHDCGTAAILPGLVDTHVHINEPGRTEWEGFATATRAAAAGGYTTLVDMPLNCLPETTTVAALEAKQQAAEGQCLVDWTTWGGAVDGNQAHILPLAQAGVPGFKCFLIYPGCDGFTSIDTANLEAALPHIAGSGLPLLVHAELAGPIDTATATLAGADWRQYSTYLASRPDEAELDAIHLLIHLCRKYKFRLHIVHLSTAQALPALAAARAEGLPITVETCPHYLHFAAEDIPNGATLYKCAPPIRSRENCDQLWHALHTGLIDMVVTDHSPCPPAMKRLDTGRFNEAWGGIASLSLALSVMWTEAQQRGFTLDHLARWMSAVPAALAGLSHRSGVLAPGREASFVLFDPEADFLVTEDRLHYRHPISPYLGETLQGVVKATCLRGRPVYENNSFPSAPKGRDLTNLQSRGAPSLTASPSRVGSSTLNHWNYLPPNEAAQEILPCCGSQAWAEALTAQRPYRNIAALQKASDTIWQSLPQQDWQQAFASHPRIGQHHAQQATARSLTWSAQEQQAASPNEALDGATRRYEAKFHRIFIVCASGKSSTEILHILESRMANDPLTELREAAEQQRQITQLRLRRWLGEA